MRSFEHMSRPALYAKLKKLRRLQGEMVGGLYPAIVQDEINRINHFLAEGLKSPDRFADTNSNEENDMARKKAHKIIVERFVTGSFGELVTEGFIFRHGEVLPREVPSRDALLTPHLVTRDFLLVKIAGDHRFLTPPTGEDNFVVVLSSEDPVPSGLYSPCPNCLGKGYAKVSDMPTAAEKGVEAHRVLAMDEEKFARDLADMPFPGRGVSGSAGSFPLDDDRS